MNLLRRPDGHVAWREVGQGPATIVWVHGLPLDSRSWRLQEDHFAPLARNVLLDLRGYGRSGELPAAVDDVTQLYVDDLHALMTELDLDDVVLVGFASGGHVTLRYAAQHPERLRRLVTLNASPRFRRGSDWPWGFDEEGIAQFTRAADQGGIEAITEVVLDPAVAFRDVSAVDARALVDWFTPMSRDAGIATLLGFFDHISRDDDRSLLDDIVTPTLLLSSAIGREVPSEVALYLRQRISGALLAELPDTDHFAFATRPRLVNQLIEQVLAPDPRSVDQQER